jgi:hypothetical protein
MNFKSETENHPQGVTAKRQSSELSLSARGAKAPIAWGFGVILKEGQGDQ